MSQTTSLSSEKGYGKNNLNEDSSLDWEPQNVILISSDRPIPELERIISDAEDQLGSLETFERQLTLLYPQTDVVISPKYLPPIMTRIQHFWGS